MNSMSATFFPTEGIFSPSHISRGKGQVICGVDLDDVLADSIPEWIKFADKESKKMSWNIDKLPYWVTRDHCDLYDLKKDVPYYYYRMLKEMYRQSETKSNLPLKESARFFLEDLKKRGYKIVIITKRGQSSSKITYNWLERNILPFDEVIFDQNKHIRILERFPEMDFMIEDNRDIANLVGKWGYRVFLLNNEYNQGEVQNNVVRIESLIQIILGGTH
ncbi:MAG TPA: hypothetical protein VJ438_01620 [Candidatus Nanoarchaeia archaeon]|nr:hypothetical protein [Candidatus Nanoarchaeia archaeon]